MQRHFDFIAKLFSHVLDGHSRNRLEMRSVAVDEPLQTLLDIQNVGNACDQVAAEAQHACELAYGLLRIVDVFETLNTGSVVKRLVGVGKCPTQVTRPYFHGREPKDLRIKIATLNLKAGFDKTCSQGSLARGHIEHFAFGKLL